MRIRLRLEKLRDDAVRFTPAGVRLFMQWAEAVTLAHAAKVQLIEWAHAQSPEVYAALRKAGALVDVEGAAEPVSRRSQARSASHRPQPAKKPRKTQKGGK